ncbi:MAG: hypothetical protein WCH86_02440 [Kiritimatiellales bacterium]
MDSTIFIRSRRVLAIWLVAPLLVVASVEFGVRTFYNDQQASYLRKQALDKFIPEMLMGAGDFDRFIKDYVVNTENSSSIEDSSIELMNTAASLAKFKITSIDVVQTRNETPNTIKIAVNVSGIGSCRSIAAFLVNIKKQDALIYEERIDLSRAVEGLDVLQMEAQLGKIYIENEGGRP